MHRYLIMLRKRLKERISERKFSGDREPEYCSPGSIEQELDMCETGSLRGEEILHHHGRVLLERVDQDPQEVDLLMSENRFQVNLSEEDREGDEMTGDDHSSGYQGGEGDSGLPGSQRENRETIERSNEINRQEEGIGLLFKLKKPSRKKKY